MKTLSEVATIALICAKTSIPVPRVLAYSADPDNALGFEWILMERPNGRPLEDCWHELSWLKKGLLVQKMVQYLNELSCLRLTSIGSLFHCGSSVNLSHEDPNNMDFVVGEAIQGEFFRGDHIQLDLHRGPYRTSSAYMSAQLSILLHDIATLSLSFDPRDHKQAEEMHIIHTKLLAVLPLLFPSTDAETTCIYHDDLSLSNILVSSSGEISGIVDWEVIIAAPAWEAFQIPSFLDICPEDRIADALSPSELEDEEAVQDHYNLVQDYEVTQLRAFFLEEMGRENPWWLETYEQESTRRDVLVAIANAGNDMYQNRIKGWLDSWLEGRIPRMTLSQSLNEDG